MKERAVCLTIGLLICITNLVGGQTPHVTTPANGLYDVLQLYEIDDSVMRIFRDGEPLSSDEFEPIYRILYLLPRIDDVQRHRWRRTPESWGEVASQPNVHRTELFLVSGRVLNVARHPLPAEGARRFGFDEFFIVDLESTLDGRTLSVCSRQIPSIWPTDPTGQPVQCAAVLLKTGQGSNGDETLVFATDRLAWLPNEADESNGVSTGWVTLGRYGVDVSRLQEVSQKTALVDADRECFYQLLWGARRMPDDELVQLARQLPVIELLQHPDELVGEVFICRGTARRALRIRVDDVDIRERFGIDHYYEIEIFTPLEQPLQLVDSRDGETRAYQNYPVTVVCTTLPAGMPEGDVIRQPVQVVGHFMKLWSFHSRFATGDLGPDDLERRQVSPLLIARSVTITQPPSTSNPWPAWTMASMVLGTFVFVLIARWRFARADRPFQRWRKARNDETKITFPDDLEDSTDQ